MGSVRPTSQPARGAMASISLSPQFGRNHCAMKPYIQRPLFNYEPLRIQDFAPNRHAFGKFCQRSNIIDVASNKLDI